MARLEPELSEIGVGLWPFAAPGGEVASAEFLVGVPADAVGDFDGHYIVTFMTLHRVLCWCLVLGLDDDVGVSIGPEAGGGGGGGYLTGFGWQVADAVGVAGWEWFGGGATVR